MIKNHEAWGALVQKWALGDDPRDFPLPRSLEDVKTQCAKMATKMDLSPQRGEPKWKAIIDPPAAVTAIAILQNSPEVLVIRLPAKAQLDDTIKSLKRSNGSYQLPAFYRQSFGNANLTVDGTKEARLKLLAQRIGDYSVNSCQ